jgi:hypothetical protein
VLSKLFETERFCLVDGEGKNIEGNPIKVAPGRDASFGMIFYSGADFNMEYALTCVADDGGSVKSPKIIFSIGADGPAEPAISTVNLYGARGTWEATDSGENYTLTF